MSEKNRLDSTFARAFLNKWPSVLVREFNEDGLKFRAMSLAYTTLLSLAPLLAVSFSILKGFGVHNQLEPLLRQVLSPLGEKADEITENLIFFVENLQVGVLGFIGFLMLFYTAISLIEQVESCFNYIWRITKPRSLYRRFSDYLSIILIGPVLLFSALGIAASMSNTAIVQQLIALEPFGTMYYFVGMLLPHVLTIAAFIFFYAFIPNTKVNAFPALVGGLIASTVWKLTGYLFAIFIANSVQYSAVYSGFAVILVSMIWLYISWLILLFGGVIVFHLQYPRYLDYPARRPNLGPLSQEQLGLVLMYEIGLNQINGHAGCTLKKLAEKVNLPWEPVADVLRCLTNGGLLVSTEGEQKNYLLNRDTDAIRLNDIIQTIRRDGNPLVFSRPENEIAALNACLDQFEISSMQLFDRKTLRDLLPAFKQTD